MHIPATRRSWRLLLAALGIGTGAALLGPVLLSGRTFVGRDMMRVYYPLRYYWAERVLAGEFPAWYPFDGFGQPFVSMMISGTFHPTNLLWLVLAPWTALKVAVAVSFAGAFAGAHRLVRNLGSGQGPAAFAAVAYACTGYLVSMNNNLPYLLAAAALPWVFAGLVRLGSRGWPAAAETAVALALMLLAGDVQNFYVASGAVLLLAAVWGVRARSPRIPLLALGSVGLAFLLTAVQWIPSRLFLPEAMAGAQSVEVAQIWSLSPARMLELLIGPLFTPAAIPLQSRTAEQLLREGTAGYWAQTVHLGTAVTLMAFLGALRGRTVARLVGAVGIAVLVVALGKWTPVYGLLFRVLPGWNAFRYPEKLVPVLALAAVVLAAGALARMNSLAPERKLGARVLCVAAVALGILAVLFRLGLFRTLLLQLWQPPMSEAAFRSIEEQGSRLALISAGVAVSSAGVVRFARSARQRSLLLTVLTGVQLVVTGHGFIESAPHDLLTTPPEFARLIAERQPSGPEPWTRVQSRFRVPVAAYLQKTDPITVEKAFILEALTTVTPALWGLESGDLYLPAANRRVLELTARPGWTEWTSQLFDVGYLVSSSSVHHRLHEGEGTVVADRPDVDLILVTRHGSPGRAFLADRSCFPDSKSLLAHLFEIDPRRDPPPGFQVCDPGSVALPRAPEGSVGEARITEYSPERVVVEVEAARPGVLVLNDALAPGWTARIDDREAAIVRTNHLVRGVDVLAGSHRVTFTFRTPGLAPAAVASGAGWGGLLVAIGVLGRKRLAARVESVRPGPTPSALT